MTPVRFIAVALAIISADASASAQTYPSRPITLVVPYTPGTGIDIIARTLAPRITERWGQPVIVDNKPGASGNLGADLVAKSAPTGTTLMVTVVTFTVAPAMTKNMPFDVAKDFTPIAEVATGSMALVVNPKVLPVASLKELIDEARKHPGTLNYGSPGSGTPQHLGPELLKQGLGIDIVHVPYRGAAGQVTDLIAGQVHFAYLPVHTAMPFTQTGQLRVLAVASDRRSLLAPDAPSFKELGYANLEMELWFGIYGPAKLPPDVVQKWAELLPPILELPEVKDTWLKQGLVPFYAPSEEFGRLTLSELARWKAVVEKAGIQPE
ncbi:MAG TPA: tripartite tricarboxylate transporter substrate binding protein [Alphaproteobacteria bacterium]